MMRRARGITTAVWAAFFVLVAVPRPGYGWGAVGHSLVNKAAAAMMDSRLGPFQRANSENLERLANVPDRLWKRSATRDAEKATHFFQWDQYATSALRSRMPTLLADALRYVRVDYVKENGSAVWRIDQLYDMLVQSLRARDWERSLQLAGVLGHYVGDVSQPMHVTSDYDGQSIGRRGIHAYYESTLVSRQDQADLYTKVLAAAERLTTAQAAARYRHSILPVVDIAFEEGKAALAALPDVQDAFTGEEPDDEALETLFVEHMAQGAVALRTLWDMAAEEAEVPASTPRRELKVDDPAWVPFELKGAQLGG
jgi:hypothetical protein